MIAHYYMIIQNHCFAFDTKIKATRPTPKYGRRKTPWKSRKKAFARCRSTKKPALTLRWSCALFCGPTPTSSWSVNLATKKPWPWGSRPPSPGTWCFPPCTPTPRPSRSPACSTWAWTRSILLTRC